jgi:hypothetical protein
MKNRVTLLILMTQWSLEFSAARPLCSSDPLRKELAVRLAVLGVGTFPISLRWHEAINEREEVAPAVSFYDISKPVGYDSRTSMIRAYHM